jgi:hypothetical protein
MVMFYLHHPHPHLFPLHEQNSPSMTTQRFFPPLRYLSAIVMDDQDLMLLNSANRPSSLLNNNLRKRQNGKHFDSIYRRHPIDFHSVLSLRARP